MEYQYAFDLCAVEAHRTGGPIVLFASSPFYARELLKRLHGCKILLVAIGEWGLWASDLQRWLGVEVDPAAFSLAPQHLNLCAYCAIWAEPELADDRQVPERVRQALLPGGKLCVIFSSRLARFLPEWQGNGERPDKHPLGLQQVMQWLRHGDFAIEVLYGFHGPRSILWGYAFRLMERLGRGDLADRCLHRMRAGYVVSGWQALWAPVGVAVARRK
nr:hypothetical protein [Chloroflexota bacterium]